MAANPQPAPPQKPSPPKCNREGCPRYGLNMWRSTSYRNMLTYACRPDKPHPHHYEQRGPHGEVVEYLDRDGNLVENPAEFRGKQFSLRYRDSETREIVLIESLHARVMGSEQARDNMRKASLRAWKKEEAKTRKAAIATAAIQLYGDPDAPETWTPEQRKARDDRAAENLLRFGDPDKPETWTPEQKNVREQMRLEALKTWQDPKVAKRRRRGTRRAMALPTYSEHMSKSSRAAHAARKAKDAAKEAELERLRKAEQEAIDLRRKADEAERIVQELRKAAQGSDERLAHTIDEVMPIFRQLFASPEVKANPRLLKRNDWILPGCSLDMMTAAGGAVENSRRPKHWPKYAAISFVATMENRERKSVQRAYDRFHASQTN